MDPKEYMSTNPTSAQGTAGFLALFAIRDADMTHKACNLVTLFRPKLRMADGWFKTLGRLHRLFLRTKRELRRNFKFEPFSYNEGFQGRSSLLPLRMKDEQYAVLDSAFGRSPSPQPSDSEMTDAPDPPIKVEHTQATEGAAREAWAAVSNMLPTSSVTSNQNRLSSPNGAPSGFQQTSAASHTSPYSASSPPPTTHQPYTPTGPPSALHNNAAAGKSMSPPQRVETTSLETPSATGVASMATTAGRSAPLWTREQVEVWLAGLETVFGANDVAAFVEAIDWREFGAPSGVVKGWLQLVWAGSNIWKNPMDDFARHPRELELKYWIDD
jgi:hypothetical protein